MKKILVFVGMQYYPTGGMGDFFESFDSVTEAKDALLKMEGIDWADGVNTETGEIYRFKC
jgi:hypothetical protein